MYSWEIEELIEARERLLDREDYLKVSNLDENPQITRVHRLGDGLYEMYTREDEGYDPSSYHFVFQVKKLKM